MLTSQGNQVLVAKFDSPKDQNSVLAKTNEDHLHPFKWNRAQAHNFVGCYVRVIQLIMRIFGVLESNLMNLEINPLETVEIADAIEIIQRIRTCGTP